MHFLIELVGGNLLKDQSNFPLVIILLILITFSLDYVLILRGENLTLVTRGLIELYMS